MTFTGVRNESCKTAQAGMDLNVSHKTENNLFDQLKTSIASLPSLIKFSIISKELTKLAINLNRNPTEEKFDELLGKLNEAKKTFEDHIPQSHNASSKGTLILLNAMNTAFSSLKMVDENKLGFFSITYCQSRTDPDITIDFESVVNSGFASFEMGGVLLGGKIKQSIGKEQLIEIPSFNFPFIVDGAICKAADRRIGGVWLLNALVNTADTSTPLENLNKVSIAYDLIQSLDKKSVSAKTKRGIQRLESHSIQQIRSDIETFKELGNDTQADYLEQRLKTHFEKVHNKSRSAIRFSRLINKENQALLKTDQVADAETYKLFIRKEGFDTDPLLCLHIGEGMNQLASAVKAERISLREALSMLGAFRNNLSYIRENDREVYANFGILRDSTIEGELKTPIGSNRYMKLLDRALQNLGNSFESIVNEPPARINHEGEEIILNPIIKNPETDSQEKYYWKHPTSKECSILISLAEKDWDKLANDSLSFEETVNHVASMQWYLFNALPFYRGSASIVDALGKSSLMIQNHQTYPWGTGISPDIFAFSMSREEFIENYTKLLDRGRSDEFLCSFN